MEVSAVGVVLTPEPPLPNLVCALPIPDLG